MLRRKTPAFPTVARAAFAAGLLALACAARAAAPPQPAQADLQAKAAGLVDAFEKQYKAAVGASVVDLRTGKTLVAVHDSDLLMPASNQKLLTSAAALARLGGDFQFTTAAYLSGRDLLVLGEGDPTLGDPLLAADANKTIYAEMDAWAAAIKAKLPAIEGDLLVCSAREAASFRHPDWPRAQYDRWYVAPVAELNFNDNCFDVSFQLQGGAIVPVIEPQSRFIQVVNRLTRGKHLWSLRMTGDDSVLTLTGSVAQATSDPLSVAVNNPPMLMGRVLADRLARAGVSLAGQVKLAKPPADAPDASLAVCKTRTPLATVLKRANKRSLNMMAECVFLRAGDNTWEGSAKIVSEAMVKSYGLSGETFTISDGSGLSRKNAVTPCAVTKLLAAVLKRPDAAALVDSLPICGTDGTMEKRLTEPACRKRVLGKTGYIAGVSALSGYVLDASGKPAMAFSFLCNKVTGGDGWQAKALQDDLCRLLVDSLKD